MYIPGPPADVVVQRQASSPGLDGSGPVEVKTVKNTRYENAGQVLRPADALCNPVLASQQLHVQVIILVICTNTSIHHLVLTSWFHAIGFVNKLF